MSEKREIRLRRDSKRNQAPVKWTEKVIEKFVKVVKN